MSYVENYRIHAHPEYNKMRTLATVGLTVACTLFLNVMTDKNPKIRKLTKQVEQNVEDSIPPVRRDANGDGLADIVLTQKNGNKITIFGQEDGSHSFKNPRGENQ